MVWYFCNSRDLTDNNRLITYGWGFSSFPLTCYFIIIASVIPNGIFILIFLWKIFRRYYPPTPSRNSTSSEIDLPPTPSIPSDNTVNPLVQSSSATLPDSSSSSNNKNNNNNNNNNNNRINDSISSVHKDFQHSSANTSRASIVPDEVTPLVRYSRLFLRYCAYIQCLAFNLFFLACIGSTDDYTSGLFTYWIINTVTWALCAVCMPMDLEDVHRYRFSVWPGILTELFFFLNMVGTCLTTISMETASYHDRTAGQIIVVVAGIISTFGIFLVGLIVLRKSRLCYYIFQDELYPPFGPSTTKRL